MLFRSFGLLSHLQDLHIYGPPALKEIIELQLKMAETHLSYALFLHTITGPGLLVETEKMRIECFPTNHRIECYGFKFTEKKPARKIVAEKAREMQIPLAFYDHLKTGADYHRKDGVLVKKEEVTQEGDKGRSYAFCADTKYDESLLEHISGMDMIYHETTYLDNFRERAEARYHSTTRQAAAMALKAGVKRLLIGHFSSKYDSLEEFEKEAREIFPNTDLALEGTVYTIN